MDRWAVVGGVCCRGQASRPESALVQTQRMCTEGGVPPPLLPDAPGSVRRRVGGELQARPLPGGRSSPRPLCVCYARECLESLETTVVRFLLCFLFNGIGRLPFLCFCQLCSLGSCEVGKTGSTSVPRPIRGSFWVSRCGRTGTRSVCAPPPAGVLLLEPGPAQRSGLVGAGRRASVAGPGPPRVDGVQTASFCRPAQGVPPPWTRPCWPRGAPLPGRGLEDSRRTGQVRAGRPVPTLRPCGATPRTAPVGSRPAAWLPS